LLGDFVGNYVGYAQLATLYYFAFFIVIMPLLGLVEKPRRLPNSITEAVLAKNKTGGAGHPAGATAAPDTKG
jgi:ubiquinol-cytochrome c reductase cytochrome b subunit